MWGACAVDLIDSLTSEPLAEWKKSHGEVKKSADKRETSFAINDMSIIFRHAVKIFYWLPLEDRFMEFIYKYKGTIVRKKLKSCNHIFFFLFSYEFEHINTEETALIWLTLKTFTLQTQEQRSEVRHD